MASNLYLCPWDGVFCAGGLDGAQQIADCLLWSLQGTLLVLIWRSRSPDMSRKPIQGPWIQEILLFLMFRYVILPFPRDTSPFYLVLLLLEPDHSCALHLASEIMRPIRRRSAEVGVASVLAPPLEWIAKWI